MDHDREELRKAINCAAYDSKPPCEVMGWFPPILAAARRDLARMEAEASTRATLEGLIETLGIVVDAHLTRLPVQQQADEVRQAAAVLRKLKEFRDNYYIRKPGEFLPPEDLGVATARFLADLP